MIISFKFILTYILGGITFIPFTVLFLYLIYTLNNQLFIPLYNFFDSNYKIIKENELIDQDLKHIDISSSNSEQLYKVGWLTVSQTEGQSSSDSSIGDMVMNYISNFTNKKENVNIFFSVLKYNTLYLYDSEKQLDCKGVINVSNFHVRIHPTGLLDAELFSKQNSIHLELISQNKQDTLNYYINCNKCIDKEDWYFSLIRASKYKSSQNDYTNDSTRFEQFAMNHLIKTVYSDEHHFQTQWLNALLGRIFVGVYRTQDIKEAVYKKVITKLDKINAKRPPFLGEIKVRSADPGHALPRFTQPKLLGLSPTGELSAEVMLQYDGGFRLEIETVLKWQYSDRLKPLTINLVLGITLKEISGKMLIKIKEPPTNRFWYAFYECPKMEWKVEPVVWEKRVGYSVVVKAIETKIQEFIMETFVLPYFDDITFFPTEGLGGIFEKPPSPPSQVPVPPQNTQDQPESPKEAVLVLNHKKIQQDRQRDDQALLTTAKSIPDLISGTPLLAKSPLKYGSSSSDDKIIQNKLYEKIQQPKYSNTINQDTQTIHSISPMLIPQAYKKTYPESVITSHDLPFMFSKSFDESVLSSSLEMEESLRTITKVLTTDEISLSPTSSSFTTNTIQTTYSQESNSSSGSDHPIPQIKKVQLRKSSSLALLRQKTGASTAINVSPAMAHKKQDEIDPPVIEV